jgi:hypothetical protein
MASQPPASILPIFSANGRPKDLLYVQSLSASAGDNDIHTRSLHALEGWVWSYTRIGTVLADRQPVVDGTASLRIKNALGACLAKIRAGRCADGEVRQLAGWD